MCHPVLPFRLDAESRLEIIQQCKEQTRARGMQYDGPDYWTPHHYRLCSFSCKSCRTGWPTCITYCSWHEFICQFSEVWNLFWATFLKAITSHNPIVWPSLEGVWVMRPWGVRLYILILESVWFLTTRLKRENDALWGIRLACQHLKETQNLQRQPDSMSDII